jgi:hypothetical protein
MEDLGNELLSLFDDDAKWLEEAAAHFENLARSLPERDRPEWQLTSAVYRERAQKHRELIRRMLQRSARSG